MESKNITCENSINFAMRVGYEKYRKRKDIRAFVEEFRRSKAQRVVSKVTVVPYHWAPRSYVPFSWGEDIVCGTEGPGQETPEDSTFHAPKN